MITLLSDDHRFQTWALILEAVWWRRSVHIISRTLVEDIPLISDLFLWSTKYMSSHFLQVFFFHFGTRPACFYLAMWLQKLQDPMLCGHFKPLHSPPELSAADLYATIVSVYCCLQPFHGEAMDLMVCGLCQTGLILQKMGESSCLIFNV